MQHTKHIWIFDFLRGMAIIGMIIFHLFFILNFFGIKLQQMHEGAWLFFGNLIRFTFIGLVGISLSLSSHKKYSQVIKRALLIILGGLIVSLVTYIFVKENTVRFGILHFIGVGIFLALPFRNLKYSNLMIAFAIYAISFYTSHLQINNFAGFVLGFADNQNIQDLDYFPLFPWISFIFLGIFIGNSLKNTSIAKLTNTPNIIKPICHLGRHSLKIYLIHIPVLLGLIAILQLLTYLLP